jgi:hypothetical protein
MCIYTIIYIYTYIRSSTLERKSLTWSLGDGNDLVMDGTIYFFENLILWGTPDTVTQPLRPWFNLQRC